MTGLEPHFHNLFEYLNRTRMKAVWFGLKKEETRRLVEFEIKEFLYTWHTIPFSSFEKHLKNEMRIIPRKRSRKSEGTFTLQHLFFFLSLGRGEFLRLLGWDSTSRTNKRSRSNLHEWFHNLPRPFYMLQAVKRRYPVHASTVFQGLDSYLDFNVIW